MAYSGYCVDACPARSAMCSLPLAIKQFNECIQTVY